VLSWEAEVKVPRQATTADCGVWWLADQRRNKRYRGEASLWQRQFDGNLKKRP